MASDDSVHVSILVCTRNRVQHLGPTLASIDEVRIPLGLRAEVLVIDNGSTDSTGAFLAGRPTKRLPLRSEYLGTPGKCRAQNLAIAQSRGTVLLWTDDDVRVRPDWVELMATPILDGRADVLQGRVDIPTYLRERFDGTPMATRMSLLGSTEHLDFSRPDMLYGPNMSFGRHVLAKVPGFDENLGPGPASLGYGDETLFGFQLLAAGFRIMGVPDSVVEHHFDASRINQASMDAIARNFGATRAYLAYRWHGTRMRHIRARQCKAVLCRFLGSVAAKQAGQNKATRQEARFSHIEWMSYLRQCLRMERLQRE